jgi:hypothetical protein
MSTTPTQPCGASPPQNWPVWPPGSDDRRDGTHLLRVFLDDVDDAAEAVTADYVSSILAGVAARVASSPPNERAAATGNPSEVTHATATTAAAKRARASTAVRWTGLVPDEPATDPTSATEPTTAPQAPKSKRHEQHTMPAADGSPQ